MPDTKWRGLKICIIAHSEEVFIEGQDRPGDGSAVIPCPAECLCAKLMVQQNCQLDSPGIYLHPGKRTDNFIVFSVHFSQLDAFAHPESHSLVREGWYFQGIWLSSWLPGENLTPPSRKRTVAAAPFSVLLPMKNGSDKIPVVSIALEIWIALSGGKQTVLLPWFLQISPKKYKTNWWSWIASLHGFYACLAEALLHLYEAVRASHPCSTAGTHQRGKKRLWSLTQKHPALAECDMSQDQTQMTTFHQNLYAFEGVSVQNKMQCCRRTRPWGPKRGVKPSQPQGWTWLTVDSIWPILSPFFPSEDFQFPNAVLTDTISPRTLTVFIFVIAWTPSTLKPQESAGAQSHHS